MADYSEDLEHCAGVGSRRAGPGSSCSYRRLLAFIWENQEAAKRGVFVFIWFLLVPCYSVQDSTS